MGIVVAAVAFILLTGSAATSAIHVRSTLQANFRGAYDILVRPKGSFTPLERERGLIRDNYLSGIYGGITMRQYRRIEHLPGVEVAAPIANIGTVLAQEPVILPLKHYLNGAQDQLFRVRFSWVSQNGLSRYPASDMYLYATRRRFDLGPQTAVVRDPLTGRADLICNGYNETKPVVLAPFVPINSSYLFCSSPHVSAALGQLIRQVPIDRESSSSSSSRSTSRRSTLKPRRNSSACREPWSAGATSDRRRGHTSRNPHP